MHEGTHALYWVQESSANYDSANEWHSRYDEGEWGDISNCVSSLSYRRALSDQTGGVRRVVRLRYAENPYEFDLTGCGTRATMPGSIMAYAPSRSNANAFLEPIDYRYTLCRITSNYMPFLAAAICAGGAPNSGTQSLSALNAPEAFSHTLRLSGSIDQADHVTTTLSYLEDAGEALSPATPGGNYHLELRATDDTLLYDHLFSLAFISSPAPAKPISRARFNLRVPFPDDAAKAEIRRDGNVLWSQTVSVNPPSVSFTSPTGGKYASDGVVPVAWSAADTDGDTLQFGLDYSPDGGQNWILLEPYLAGDSFDWQPGFIPTGEDVRLRLRASDGFNTATALSAPFALTPRAPYAFIQSPDVDQLFPEGMRINLAGLSLTSDGPNAGVFEWQHDGVPISAGQAVSYTLDQVGQHVFSLQVTANSLTASDGVTITVVPDYDRDSMPNDWELIHILNPLDASDVNDDPDGDGVINVREHQLGTNPRQADTDGDGADDGTELTYGTDPLVPEQVPPSGSVLNVGAEALHFTLKQNDAPAKTVFWVTNGGPGNLKWTASSEAGWLGVSPGSGDAPTEITISAAPSSLESGEYAGHVTFTAIGAEGSPYVIDVTLTIEPVSEYWLYLPLLTR